jgi:hypothetical protein
MNRDDAKKLSISPYSDLPPEAFWSSGVANRNQLEPGNLYNPTIGISRRTRFTTAGSCFAQHVGRALRLANLNLNDTEPMPGRVPDKLANRFGYRLFSARYGNIYTVRHMLQLWMEAFGEIPQRDHVWEKNGRYFDAFRPAIEPEGFSTPEEVHVHRKAHLAAVRQAMEDTDVLVFTLGMTESWISLEDGSVYPTCPGTIAGQFDPKAHTFHNFTYPEVMADIIALRNRLTSLRKKARIVLTVSPVPLTATASGDHIEIANSYSKSVLRAASSAAASKFKNVVYFPSYEVITSQNARGAYFANNQRSVVPEGVGAAMQMFLKAHKLERTSRHIGAERMKRREEEARARGALTDDVICEEALLEVFKK